MTNSGLFQGMEDVLVLEDMLKQHPDDRKKAFEAYSLHRQPDAHAIVDLAMYNYIEVRFHCLELLTKRQMHIMHITMHYICIYNAYTKRQMHIPKDKCI